MSVTRYAEVATGVTVSTGTAMSQKSHWSDDAYCRDEDLGLFFDREGSEKTLSALGMCHQCKVRLPCLKDTILWEIAVGSKPEGVSGGISGRGRIDIKKQVQVSPERVDEILEQAIANDGNRVYVVSGFSDEGEILFAKRSRMPFMQALKYGKEWLESHHGSGFVKVFDAGTGDLMC